jgi:hypothetical protein
MEIQPSRKKKVDYAALQSPLARIPGMSLAVVRILLNLGFDDLESLRGRSPEAIHADAAQSEAEIPHDLLGYLRMAVYYVEAEDPDPDLLLHWKWQD